MSEKAKWRLSAWLTAAILTIVYLTLVGLEIPRGYDDAGALGYRIGFLIGYTFAVFVPIWIARVIYNKLPKEG